MKNLFFTCIIVLITISCSTTPKDARYLKAEEHCKNKNYHACLQLDLLDRIPDFQKCYNEKLSDSKNPFSGQVKLEIVASSTGKVKSVKATSKDKLPNETLDCVKSVVKSILFTKSVKKEDIKIIQPLNLRVKK